VAGYLPWLITRWEPGTPPAGALALRLLGVAMIVGGFIAVCGAFFHFAWFGRGTPAPVAPPQALVVSGLNRYVRNPMYLSVSAMVVGQALWLWRFELLWLVAAFVPLTHLFVVAYEEPTLKRQFGEAYDRYCVAVPRWMPRLSRRR
jgi:protein-S-isoprenylcysteine O-methyltransferase Ste14